MPLHIDRCYCFDQSFASLKEVADREGLDTLEALQGHVVFGKQCTLCHPYVRRMLRTGMTVFDHLVFPQDEPPSGTHLEPLP